MYKKGNVFFNGELAGVIQYKKNQYTFTYEKSFFENPEKPSISVTFPKSRREYSSPELFPFFFGLLAEGSDKELQCRTLKIDAQDHFTRLLKTAGNETIGAVTVQEAV